MRRAIVGTLGLTLTAGFLVAMGSTAQAQPDDGHGPKTSPQTALVDDLPNPLEEKRRELRQTALTDVLSGRRDAVTKHGSKVVRVGKTYAPLTKSQRDRVRRGHHVKQRKVDQYVELSREKTDRIFVVLAEFGNERHPDFPDQDTDPNTPGPVVFDGPLHNAIPEPDRRQDNSTVWRSDYDADYFRDLYFGTGKKTESLKTYYEKQSSGRYSVDGEVTDWVKVRYNEARYGRSNGYPCASSVCNNTWNLIADAVTQWVADQKAAGRTDAQIKADLASFDQWDRYDHDNDGDFNEPDGYIDHFQIVHAGGDQADGDPWQGEDAIWSHRWYAFVNQAGQTGPADNPLGGTQIGDSGIWVGDYTMQPENGGLSVFAHEYGHDLGLPDLYDTSGLSQGATEYWSLMAQSRLSAKGDEGIGTRPGDFGAWEKLQLGWFDYETALAGERLSYKLGPHEYNSKNPQGLVVVLPKKTVTTPLATPTEGSKSWWSGTGDDLSNTMGRSVTLPAGTATLSFQTQYNIEAGYDFAYVEADDGTGWKTVAGDIAKAENNGIDGDTNGAWVDASFDLSAYAGKTIGLRIRYTTDGGVAGNKIGLPQGIFVDNLKITAGQTEVFADGAENPPNGWQLDGFTSVGNSITQDYDNFYLASYRSYTSYDKYLQSGPYNFGWPTKPDWVEHFPYQDGLLVSYWDTSQANNNVGEHPGEGQILPVDAHPRPIFRLDGGAWRVRVALYDATFGTQKADSFYLHFNGQRNYIRGQDAVPVFDDTKSYWDSRTPHASVKVANAGVTIKVTEQKDTSMKVQLGVSKGGLRAASTR
ncbi:putative M6 family peptidase [Microlunatus phosphovorus NM-1]|uniref:Putative M6 family peptidase n=1 Tax=Microlunatus phosphovorus (strain ATCC 700054 / DSM 10555 / JCM 9379 / NBRC 101784 / NCIMB 13414 / VKM Ac-1990 / NM-1) TaxID=1032480 RepID=F5XEP3_MICPN|nr:immune inhibitor A domain-containing protein [Microlunatus phosphovorus]BAK35259.1 putative M6 family peptidase [Microlunatus phosphovorus NM-1]